jgi:transposase
MSSCGVVAERQQSWYQRSLCDLPAQGIPVVIRLRVRKWPCDAQICERSIYAERPPGLAPHVASERRHS